PDAPDAGAHGGHPGPGRGAGAVRSKATAELAELAENSTLCGFCVLRGCLLSFYATKTRVIVPPRDARLPARAETQQPPRVVSAPQGAVRARGPRADAGHCRAPGTRSARDCARNRRRSEDCVVSDLPRHAVFGKQDAVQDPRRRGVSVAGPREARGRGAVLP